MHKLSSPAADPIRLEPVPGVVLHLRPLGRAGIAFARRAAGQEMLPELKGLDVPEGASLGALVSPAVLARSGDAFTVAAVQFGVLRWEGVGDAGGVEIPPTAARIAELLETDEIFAAIERDYVQPALDRLLEGNASGAALNGSSAAAPTSAGIAPPAAKPVRKSSTRRKR